MVENMQNKYKTKDWISNLQLQQEKWQIKLVFRDNFSGSEKTNQQADKSAVRCPKTHIILGSEHIAFSPEDSSSKNKDWLFI